MKMQIVINMSNHVYSCLKKRVELGIATEVDMIIDKGVVLPEHHGRLIDADKLKASWNNSFFHKVCDAIMDDAPTVLPSSDTEYSVDNQGNVWVKESD